MPTELSQLIHNTNLGIIGPLPPPIGGISIHVQRFIHSHPKTNIFNTANKTHALFIYWINLFHFVKNNNTIILHDLSSRTIALIPLFCILFNTKLITYIHNSRFHKNNKTNRIYLLKILFKLSHYVISVSNIPPNIQSFFKIKSVIQEAEYLPPTESIDDVISNYPSQLISKLFNSKNIISTCAFQLAEYNQQDLYGIDICIEAAKKLKDDGVEFILIIGIANPKFRPEYLNKLKGVVTDEQLGETIHFLEGQYIFWPIIKHSEIYLRATNTDGDSITIREAIDLGTTVIASDSAPRPKECFLFKNRNQEELVDLIKKVIANED